MDSSAAAAANRTNPMIIKNPIIVNFLTVNFLERGVQKMDELISVCLEARAAHKRAGEKVVETEKACEAQFAAEKTAEFIEQKNLTLVKNITAMDSWGMVRGGVTVVFTNGVTMSCDGNSFGKTLIEIAGQKISVPTHELLGVAPFEEHKTKKIRESVNLVRSQWIQVVKNYRELVPCALKRQCFDLLDKVKVH
jgi:hypothetical protein